MAEPAVVVALGVAALAVRVVDLGRYGFWNDEAWVALSTRVVGANQFWLSLSTTPPLWAATLRTLALAPGPPETLLRLFPLAFGCLGLWLAHRVGRSLGGRLGGVLALAAVAFDPGSVEYSKLLKQYSAEACLGLLAVEEAIGWIRGAGTRHLVWVALVLAVGAGFASTQLLIAPPILATLLADALVCRDRPRARAVLVASVAVAAWDLGYFVLAVAPRLTPALAEYWNDAYLAGSPGQMAGPVLRGLIGMLAPTWSRLGLAIATAGAVALVAERASRSSILAVVLLIAEVAALSILRRVPFNAPRVMLFMVTIVNVHLAAGIGVVLARLWSREVLRPVAVLVVVGLAYGLATGREWRSLSTVSREDMGRLVRTIERERRVEDGILLYDRSAFVFAYYARATPVLVPTPTTSVGFVPLIADPAVSLLRGDGVEVAVARAVAAHPRVWFAGSRFRAGDETRIRQALVTRGRVVLERTGARALLLLIER